MPKDRRSHIPALDGMRGAAVAAVIAFHAGYLDGGYLGVDLFFVLSGYLITGILVAEAERDHAIRLGAFWARRARRLLPALFLLLAAVGIWGMSATPVPSGGSLGKEMLAALGYYSNWQQLFGGGGYWSQFGGPRVLEHLWSLAIEEQFYVVWPLIAWACARPRRGDVRRRLGVVVVLAAIASVVVSQVLYSRSGGERVYLGTDTRILAMLGGSALACVRWPTARRLRRITNHILDGLGVAAALGLAWAWGMLSGTSSTLYRGGLIACSFAAAVTIAAGAVASRGFIARVFSFAPLRALGTISYGLYLWHWPVFVWFGVGSSGFDSATRACIATLVSLAIATVSYFAIEAPIRYRRVTTRPVVALLVIALGASTFLVIANSNRAVPRSHTKQGSFSLPTISSPSTSASATPTSAVGNVPSSASAPSSSAPTRPLRLLVVGDSVAASLGDAFQPIAANYDFQVGVDATVGCHYVAATRARDLGGALQKDYPTSICQTRLAGDIATFDPDVIYLTTLANTFLEFEVNGAWIGPCTSEYDAAVTSALETVVDRARATQARVLIGTTMPREQWFGVTDAMQAEHLRRARCHNALLKSFAKQHQDTVAIADVYTWACPKNACLKTMNGVELRPDLSHFEGEGAKLLIDWLAPQIRKLGIR